MFGPDTSFNPHESYRRIGQSVKYPYSYEEMKEKFLGKQVECILLKDKPLVKNIREVHDGIIMFDIVEANTESNIGYKLSFNAHMFKL